METQRSANPLAPAAVLGACLLLGLVVGGWVLGSQIKDIKLADRYVTVKGLVERTVKSDSAIWPVSFKEAANQGVFSISAADSGGASGPGEEGGGGGDAQADSSIMKKVRVVATVDYYLVR